MAKEFVSMMYCEELFYSKMAKVVALTSVVISTYVVCRIAETIISF